MSYYTFFFTFYPPSIRSISSPLSSSICYYSIFSGSHSPLPLIWFIFYRLVEISDESRATVAAAIVKGVKLSIVGTAAEALDM